MNKYYGTQASLSGDVRWMLMPDESIIWQGTPKKKAFVINSSTKMMPIALLWLLCDGTILTGFIASGAIREMAFFIIPFFAVHLMPVWVWIYNIFTSFGRWGNTSYVVTTHRVLIRNGMADAVYESISFADIAHVSLYIGGFDKMLGVGDVSINLDSSIVGGSVKCSILDIEDYQYVYETIQRSVADARMRTPMDQMTVRV